MSSITAILSNQQQLDSLVLGYLSNHSQHIDSISLTGGEFVSIKLRQLPPELTKLTSLAFKHLHPQLQPGKGYQGLLAAAGAAALPLKQLRLDSCSLLDHNQGLAAALARLPSLEHLSIVCSKEVVGYPLHLPLQEVLPGLQQLTYLKLQEVGLARANPYRSYEGSDSSEDSCSSSDEESEGSKPLSKVAVQMQHLSVLTRLADLRLLSVACRFTASMLSGVQSLTHLQLKQSYDRSGGSFDPAALAGRTLLQHLDLQFQSLLDHDRGEQLLSQLQQLLQLTSLRLNNTRYPLYHVGKPLPPAAAFVAMTASSKLQHNYSSGAASFQQECGSTYSLPAGNCRTCRR
jgi:hypothetical protein